MNKKTLSLNEVFKNDINDPEFQKYDRLIKPYYDLVTDIINRRVALNLTQKDLAKKVKTFQSRISKIESGEHDLRLGTIIQIAEALETELVIQLVPIERKNEIDISQEIINMFFNSRKDSEFTENVDTEQIPYALTGSVMDNSVNSCVEGV